MSILWINNATAQTWSEWFKQRKTQIKYYLQQIGELQIYIEQAQKGYAIVQEGLQTIEQIKSGEFSLHTAFFDHLKEVSPAIKEVAGAAELVVHQLGLYQRSKKMLQEVTACGLFTPDEIMLFTNALTDVVSGMAQTIQELNRATERGKLAMTDDQRLRRIHQLQRDCQQQENDFRRMEQAITSVAEERWQQSTELERLRRWHNVP